MAAIRRSCMRRIRAGGQCGTVVSRAEAAASIAVLRTLTRVVASFSLEGGIVRRSRANLTTFPPSRHGRGVDLRGAATNHDAVEEHLEPDGGRVALTFDDGPTERTPGLLDVLQALDVRATFFVVGCHITGYEALLRRAVAEGHEIGNHSRRHAHMGGARLVPALADLLWTSARVRQATGRFPRAFRPPYGDCSRALRRAARAGGMRTVLWDVDPRDWEGRRREEIHAHVAGHARDGSIVLMHDGAPGAVGTPAAVEPIVASLRQRGLALVTVSELLAGRR